MTHYSRIAERNSETPAEWLTTCSQIGEVANTWAGRTDLAVYAGEDAGAGQALACYVSTTSEIEISLPRAFGKATTPAMVGDLRLRSNQYEFPEATGVIYHEALHARFSDAWNITYLQSLIETNRVKDAFWLLEESRIEGLGVQIMPENALFLRSSAMELSFKGADEGLDEMNATEGLAQLAGLALARVDAGVLDEFDVALLEEHITNELGKDVVDTLRSIWIEFQSLNGLPSDHIRGANLAKKWVETIDATSKARGEKPTPEIEICFGLPDEGKSESGSGSGSIELPEAVKGALEALEKAVEKAMVETADALAEQEADEKRAEVIKAKQSEATRQTQNKEEAGKIFSTASGVGDGKSGSRLEAVRPPKPQERASAVRLAQLLDKAKYRERSITEVKTHEPAGRLRMRTAIQNKALEAKGIRETNPAWRKTVRKHNDDPTISIGVMVDISGSMRTAMNPMASIAWILSEAGRRVQAKSAMVYFGSGVFPTLKVGQRLEQVSVYSATDSTEEFGKAYSALDGALNLVAGDGVRLLVIVSDGNFRGDQDKAVLSALAECERNGVGVLWIAPKECYSSGGAELLIKGTNAQFLKVTEMDLIAEAIGKSASLALARFA